MNDECYKEERPLGDMEVKEDFLEGKGVEICSSR